MESNFYQEMHKFELKDWTNLPDNLLEEENTTNTNTAKNFSNNVAIEQDTEQIQNASPIALEIKQNMVSGTAIKETASTCDLLIKEEAEISDNEIKYFPENPCNEFSRIKEYLSTQNGGRIKLETHPLIDFEETHDWKIKNEELDIMDCLEGSKTSISTDGVGQASQGKCEEYILNKSDRKNQKNSLKGLDLEHKYPEEAKVDLPKNSLCDNETMYEEKLDRHMDLTNGQSEYQRIFESHINKHLRNSAIEFRCSKCDFQTIHKNNLKLHLLEHNNAEDSEMFKCNQCDFQTAYKHSLKNHIMFRHYPEELQKFKCDQCSYKTIFKRALDVHFLRHKNPDEVEMFKCHKCDFKTVYKKNLRAHSLRHNDPKEVQNFKCDHCSYKTIIKGDLSKHFLRHKNPEELEIFKCNKCNFQTIYKQSLQGHLRRHNKKSQDVQKQLV